MLLGRGRPMLACVCVLALVIVLLPVQALAAGDPNHESVQPAGLGVQAVTPKDSFEPDDTTATARPMPAVSRHTWHPVDELNDPDWMYFWAEATGTVVMLETYTPVNVLNFSDPYIKVYDVQGALNVDDDLFNADGALVGNDDHKAYSGDAGLVFVAPHPGRYYVRVESDDLDRGQWGEYWLFAWKGIGRRLSGATRYDTAVAVSRLYLNTTLNADMGAGLPRGPATGLVIANGRILNDSAAAGMLAAASNSPLLLTDGPFAMTPAMWSELNRLAQASFGGGGLAATKGGSWGSKLPVYVVGGRGSVSDPLVAKIDANPYLGEVIRIAGPDRYSTAAAVMDRIMGLHMVPTSQGLGAAEVAAGAPFTAFIASGDAPADVVAAAPVASAMCGPLLLTRKGLLPKASLDWIRNNGIERVVVVGGTGTIANTVLTALAAEVGPGNVLRVAGPDRYTTCKALVDWEIANIDKPMDTRRMILVSGTAPADAITGVPLSSALDRAPILLTNTYSLNPTVKQYIDQHKPLTEVSYLVGGPGSVSPAVYALWNRYGQPFPQMTR